MKSSIRFFQWFIGVGLLISPFCMWLPYFSPFEPPKVWFIVAWTILSLLVTVFFSIWHIGQDRIMALLVFGLLSFLMVTSLGRQFFSSFFGNPYRQDGLLALTALVTFAYVIALTWHKHAGAILFGYIGMGAALLSAWAVAATVYSPLVPHAAWWLKGIALSMGNPNYLGGYLGVALPFTAYNIHHIRYRRFWYAALFTQAVAIIATGSIGGMLALVLFVLFSFSKRIGSVGTMILAACIIFSAIGLYTYTARTTRLFGAIVAEDRVRILTKGLLAIKERPLTGWGWAQFSRAFSVIDWPYHYTVDAAVDRPHSSLLDMGVSGGIPALILFLALALRTLYLLGTRLSPDARVLFFVTILYLVQSQTNITSISEDLLFWLAIGVAMASCKSLPE